MVSVNRQLLLVVFAAIVLVFQADETLGHWNLEPRFWAADGNEKFFLRIHNGAHANRKSTKKDLNVCFWIEKVGEGSNSVISDKKCSAVVMKPDEWLTFEFSLRDAVLIRDEQTNGKLIGGRYRAVAMAREQQGWFMKLIFGAAMERVYVYFEVK